MGGEELGGGGRDVSFVPQQESLERASRIFYTISGWEGGRVRKQAAMSRKLQNIGVPISSKSDGGWRQPVGRASYLLKRPKKESAIPRSNPKGGGDGDGGSSQLQESGDF